MFIFKIGHGAYRGKNELAFCFSKASAIRTLVLRGATQAQSKKAIDFVTSNKNENFKTITVNYESIEIQNYMRACDPENLKYFIQYCMPLWKKFYS
jgi:hypothetical protein